MADRLRIPASTGPDDRLPGLIFGWFGPAIMPDGEAVVIRLAPSDRVWVASLDDPAQHPRPYQPTSIALDARRPEVRHRVVDVLGALGHDLRWAEHRPGLTPDMSAEHSAEILACSVARVRVGLGPAAGRVRRFGSGYDRVGDRGDDCYGAVHHVGDGVWLAWYRCGNARFATVEEAHAYIVSGLLSKGLAVIGEDGTLTCPWPEDQP